MRKAFRRGLRLGLLAGLVAGAVLALRSRRTSGGELATGVHGDWPPVNRSTAAEPSEAGAPAPAGDHHPHGRVQVPAEAAPMGAPPALSDQTSALPPEPAVPVPAEQLDEPAPAPAPQPVKATATKKVAKKAQPAKKTVKKAAPPPAWVAPEGSSCPASHPVKAKLSSRLFHLPGMFAYTRTVPDRCYLDPAAAEADGLTRAKR